MKPVQTENIRLLVKLIEASIKDNNRSALIHYINAAGKALNDLSEYALSMKEEK